MLRDPTWWTRIWADAVAKAIEETGIVSYPDECPWATDEILDQAWMPQ